MCHHHRKSHEHVLAQKILNVVEGKALLISPFNVADYNEPEMSDEDNTNSFGSAIVMLYIWLMLRQCVHIQYYLHLIIDSK